MSTTVLKTTIRLRKDTAANFESVASTFVPLDGEVCLVDMPSYGLRIKVGDGIKTFAQLDYLDTNNNVVLTGYYFNENFYVDSTYQVALEKGEKHIYLDKNTNDTMYVWTGSVYARVAPEATDTVAGIMKLYKTSGSNEDGTMTQKVITDGVKAIKFSRDASDDECLTLDLPWD